ncbi:hypothetical protein ACLEPN_41900 [Myxococcus sp. 1LA]
MTVPADVHQAEERVQSILKAVVVGARVDEPASRPGGEESVAFSEAGALQPPYEPEALCLLVEHSNSLRQNVDAYATNIDGFGYRFEPAIDFDADGAQEKVADAMALERLAARETPARCLPGRPYAPRTRKSLRTRRKCVSRPGWRRLAWSPSLISAASTPASSSCVAALGTTWR